MDNDSIADLDDFCPSSLERDSDTERGMAGLDALAGIGSHAAHLLTLAKTTGASAFWHALDGNIDLLKTFSVSNPPGFQAWRSEIKAACSKINLKDLDKMLRPPAESSDSFATELAVLAETHCTLWHDEDKTAFASYEADGHREHWRIDSSGFADWLASLAYAEKHTAPSAESVKTCVNALSGKAKFDGEQHTPHMRVAQTSEGYWIDMGGDSWSAILVTTEGWQIVAQPSVKFIRTKTTRALPMPVMGGSVADLWDMVNVAEADRLLILAWILECYRPNTPYLVAELTGEAGSAKSSSQTVLREFTDPSQIALRGRPKSVEDVFVASSNSHLVSYENLSSLSNDQSDALCTVCTGGGYASRQLYTNSEESVLKAHNPVILNGISPVVIRPDLLDRSISITLNVIDSDMRIGEEQLKRRITEHAPSVMGALLSLFAETLAILPTVETPAQGLPRMADFCLFGEAMARALGYRDGTFVDLYEENRKTAIGRSVESSPVAGALLDYIERNDSYTGTVKNLLDELNRNRPEHEKEDYWPRSPKGLGDALRRYTPALRQLGITIKVQPERRRDGIHCAIYKTPESARAGVGSQKQVHDVHKITDDTMEIDI